MPSEIPENQLGAAAELGPVAKNEKHLTSRKTLSTVGADHRIPELAKGDARKAKVNAKHKLKVRLLNKRGGEDHIEREKSDVAEKRDAL